MKRFVIISILLIAGLWGGLAAQTGLIRGIVTGMPEETVIRLSEAVGNKLVARDSVTLSPKGGYEFSVNIEEPAFYIIDFAREHSPNIHVMLLPGERVEIDMRYAPSWNHLRITGTKGSRNMEMYRKFNNLVPVGQDEVAQWNLKTNVAELITEYKDCLMSAFMVTFFEEDFSEYGELYKIVRDALWDKYSGNLFVRHLDDRLRTAVVPGMMAPDIAMKDFNGKERKLSDLRGKVVLLDFWASWCGPCRKENPNVVKIYQKYHPQGFEIYSVSLDKDKNAWMKAIADDGLLWENHVSDLNGWTSTGGRIYGISSVPATVLIDAEGKVIARNLRGIELENKLREIFGN